MRNTKTKAKTTASNSQSLVNLGLTKSEAACYQLLLTHGVMEAKKISELLDLVQNVIYRLTESLSNKGFIVELKTSPKSYQAIPPTIALDSYTALQKQRIEEFKLSSIRDLAYVNPEPIKARVDFVFGQKDYFNKFTELSKSCKQEILVISIGEAVPDGIKLATRDALLNGVTVKIIFHKFDEENKELVKSWVKMGCEARYYPGSGYHMNIFDGKTAVLVANNPKNTKERTGMVIKNNSLSDALRNHFYSVWENGSVISRA